MVYVDGISFSDGYLAKHPGIKEAVTSKMIEGVPFTITGNGNDIHRGDTYIAERNSGLKLLTCKKNDRENGWVEPVEDAYPYDTYECIKIELNV